MPDKSESAPFTFLNGRSAYVSDQDNLPTLIAEQAARTPAAEAVVAGEDRLSYCALETQANQLAQYLRRHGVQPGARVGVCLDRSASLVVALLGILKAGAAYLPLDPIYPADRIAYVLADAEASLLLTQQSLLPVLGTVPSPVICLDRDREQIAREATTPPAHSVGPEELAYVIYTSGSTGKPKGVQIEHRALTNFLLSMQQEPGMRAHDRLMAVTTLAFDIAALELFLPLISGACVILVPGSTAADGHALLQLLEQQAVTMMQATPATWRLLLEAGWAGRPTLTILCGGEPLPQELAQQLLPRCAALWNMYGPTETTIWSTCGRIRHAEAISIGRPIANTQLYILDEQQQPVPVGVPGELYIGGAGVARGYVKRPELTAERFIAHPWQPGARLYRTGDLARYRPDGTVDCLGRLDHQVKLRGYRIELGEIEYVLGSHPAVKQCVVMAREDRPGDKRLVAYCELHKEQGLTTAEMRSFLKKELPDYMVPTAFVIMDSYPLTPNGKIDRRALPPPSEGVSADGHREFVPPHDLLEQALANTWSKVLDKKQVGLEDDFFDSGGNSLTAMSMLLEVQKLTGKMLPLATLFQASTIKALAAILREQGWTPSWSCLVPIRPGGSRKPLFMIHAAEGNVLLYRLLAKYLAPDWPVYGLQAQGLSGSDDHLTTVQTMASRYVKEMLEVQADGPFFLGGYCLGGSIALEVAQQLRRLGHEVSAVFLLDTYNASLVTRAELRLLAPIHLIQNLWFHAANFVSIPAREKKEFFLEKLEVLKERLAIRLQALGHAIPRLFGRRPHHFPHLMVKKTNDQAFLQYLPAAYDGRVVVIRPRGNFSGLASPTLGWDHIVQSGLEVYELPVYPKGMLVEPFCRLTATAMNECLDRAVTSASRGISPSPADITRPTKDAA